MLGDMLRAERERQNLTIKDIEKGTSIRALYIESIETGDYGQLPGEVYTKGFIRNYANFLKMDADEMVKRFTEENHPEQAAAQAKAEAEAAAAKEVRKASPEAQPVRQPKQANETSSDFRNRVEKSHKSQNMLLIAVLVLAVGAGAFYLLSSSEDSASKAQNPQPAASQQAKAPKTEQPAAAPAPEPKKNDGVEVVASLSARCWTQVKADGKTIYEGTLEKGKTETWKAKEKLVITAGDAGAMAIKVNGKDSGTMGDKGQVAERTYTPEGETTAANQSKKDSKK